MKRVWMLTAVLLLVMVGCTGAEDPQSLAALEDVMAIAAYEIPNEEVPTACWDGTYGNVSRTITLTQGADGSLQYCFSDGDAGSAAEVTGAAAKAEELYFSLSGDTLSVVGGIYTGNYDRQ